MTKEEAFVERTGGAWEVDPKTGKVKRTEPELQEPSRQSVNPKAEPAPALADLQPAVPPPEAPPPAPPTPPTTPAKKGE